MGWHPLRDRRERRLVALEEYRAAKRLADEDVTSFGEQLSGLHFELLTTELDETMRRDYAIALDRYEEAKTALASAALASEVTGVEPMLTDGRFHLACVLAARDGLERPARMEPCFFDPRHAPAARDVPWTPPGGVERQIAVCLQDADRLAGGEDPAVRLVRVGDRWVPWYAAGGTFEAVVRHHTQHSHALGSVSRSNKHIAEATTRAGAAGIGIWRE